MQPWLGPSCGERQPRGSYPNLFALVTILGLRCGWSPSGVRRVPTEASREVRALFLLTKDHAAGSAATTEPPLASMQAMVVGLPHGIVDAGQPTRRCVTSAGLSQIHVCLTALREWTNAATSTE